MQTDIFWIEGNLARRLAVLPRPRGGDWLEDEVRALRAAGVDVLVSLLVAEEAAELDLTEEAIYCAACGIEFISYPIADRESPASATDTRSLVRSLASLLADGKAVAIHCRQGVGRSALVAACVLILLGDRPETALERVARARRCPVPDTAEQRSWVLWFAEKYLNGAVPTTLLLSNHTLPAAPALREAARNAGWAVVEFNPAWNAALLGADPAAVLGVLGRACRTLPGVPHAPGREELLRL